MSTPAPFDVVVVGGGPGGYVAALRAAQLNLRVALVERDQLGGVCLNWGCIPTKALLHAADSLRRIRGAAALGIDVGEIGVDLPRMVARSRQVAGQLNGGVKLLLRKAGVEVIAGSARFVAGGELEVQGHGGTRSLPTARVILATGAHARALPGLPFDGQRVWNYMDALKPQALPASLLVVGAGAIGMEFASFYATLGCRVTVIEAQPEVLPEADADVSRFVREAFEREGISIRTGASVIDAAVSADAVTVEVSSAGGRESLSADHVLVAIGLRANTDGLGLEHTGVRLHNACIQADGWGATSDARVYAIGDVVGPPMLAHRASHQAVACIERIAGLRNNGEEPHAPVPACTYCHPQTASVGMTERQAVERGLKARIGSFPLRGNGKAIAIGEAHGFVKTIFDSDSGALLGAHIVGHDATELIHGFALAVTLESTEAELMETVFPHPTLSEAMHESVLAAFDRALHI